MVGISKRTITKTEEQIYRMCHQDFGAMTTKTAAEELGVSQGHIQRTLRNLKKKAPQLFPILTERQVCIYKLISIYGCTHREVAIGSGISESTVDSIVATMRAKGVYFNSPHKTVQYKKYMDRVIERRF